MQHNPLPAALADYSKILELTNNNLILKNSQALYPKAKRDSKVKTYEYNLRPFLMFL